MNQEVADARTKVDELKARLGLITEAVVMVEHQIKNERADIPEGRDILEQRVGEAAGELNKLQNEIDAKKAEARGLKNNIKERKNVHDDLPHDRKMENRLNLSGELKTDGARIIECESAIGALEMRKHAAEQALALAQVALESYKAGVHEKPVEEDPRMKAVLEEKEEIKAELEEAEAELKRLLP